MDKARSRAHPASAEAASVAVLPAGCLGMCLCAFLIGCLSGGDSGRKGVKVKAEFMRVLPGPVSGAPKRILTPDRTAFPGNPDGPAWSSAVSITSFRVPIKQISLHNAAFTQQADLYRCSGSNAECQVEAAGAAFQNELDAAPATVEPGVYPYLFVKTCEDSEAEFSSAVTATVSLGGRSWHTHPTAVLDSIGPARPVFVRTRGCGRTYALPRPVRISDSLGEQVSLRLYFDIEEIAYAALGSRATAAAWTPMNCAGDRPAETDASSPPFLCIGYPELSGIIDTVPVALERYRINGGATLGLFFTGRSDLPVGGYLRRYYQEGTVPNPGFNAEMPIRDLRMNEDRTLYLAEFGGGPRGLEGSEFRVYAFQRADHAGIFSGPADSLGVLATGTYSAIRLPP